MSTALTWWGDPKHEPSNLMALSTYNEFPGLLLTQYITWIYGYLIIYLCSDMSYSVLSSQPNIFLICFEHMLHYSKALTLSLLHASCIIWLMTCKVECVNYIYIYNDYNSDWLALLLIKPSVKKENRPWIKEDKGVE